MSAPCRAIGRFGQWPATISVRPGRCPNGAGNRRFHRCSPIVQSRRAACAATGRSTGPSDVDALSVVYVGQAAALLATRSGTLVPVTAGPTGLVPGGLGVPDQAALAPVLAGWSAALADGHRAAAIDLRAWHAAATAVELRIPAADRAGVTAAQLAELDRGLPDPPSGAAGFAPGERAAELARLALEARSGRARRVRRGDRRRRHRHHPGGRRRHLWRARRARPARPRGRARTARRGRDPAAVGAPRAPRGTCWRPRSPAATPRG